MKIYKINSPAYKANGLNGTYYSVAVCEDNGDFIKIFGDHAFAECGDRATVHEYKNINDIIGLPFSDSDRFINVKEVVIDLNAFNIFINKYTEESKLINEYDTAYSNKFKNLYDFLYCGKKKINKENEQIHNEWIIKNPRPERTVNYYDFLKFINNEN